MAKKTPRSKSRRSSSRKSVALNPWIPAVPLKGGRFLKPVLAVPLALMTGAAAANILPARALTVPSESASAVLSAKEYADTVGGRKAAILRKFEGKSAFELAQGKRKGQQSS